MNEHKKIINTAHMRQNDKMIPNRKIHIMSNLKT